jgi:hypothetical protein
MDPMCNEKCQGKDGNRLLMKKPGAFRVSFEIENLKRLTKAIYADRGVLSIQEDLFL